MNVIDLICAGFKKVYSGEKIAEKHVFLLIITTIFSFVTMYFDDIADKMKQGIQVNPNITVVLGALIVAIVIGAYLWGYALKLMHNSFDKDDIMPEFDSSSFSVFFRVLPLTLVWFGYIILAMIVTAILFATKVLGILGILLMLAVFVIAPFIQFIFAAYSKNYEAKGLFNIMLPFQYVPSTILPLILLGLAFIPVWIVFFIVCFVVGFSFGLMNMEPAATIAGGVLGGYFGAIFQFVSNYAIVQIYKERVEME